MSTINERFRELRKMLGLSQEEFAQKANRTRSEIKNIEYNVTIPKEEVIASVCKTYNVDRLWLETGSGEPFMPLSKKEELAAIFGDILSGRTNEKNAFIEAIAMLPEDVFETLVKSWIEAAEHMKEQLKTEKTE